MKNEYITKAVYRIIYYMLGLELRQEDELMKGWKDKLMNEWKDERIDELMEGWMNEWMNAWMNEINKLTIIVLPTLCIEYSRVGIYSVLEQELRQGD